MDSFILLLQLVAIVAVFIAINSTLAPKFLFCALVYTYIFEHSEWKTYQEIKSGRATLSIVTCEYYHEMRDKLDGYFLLSDIIPEGGYYSIWDKENNIALCSYWRPMIDSLIEGRHGELH